jgi:hypothetical protein
MLHATVPYTGKHVALCFELSANLNHVTHFIEYRLCDCTDTICMMHQYTVIVRAFAIYKTTKIYFKINFTHINSKSQGHEALGFKLEGRWLDSRCGHCIFQMIYYFQPHNGPGVDSAFNRNEY